MGKMSSKQMRKVEQIKPFGRSRAPRKTHFGHFPGETDTYRVRTRAVWLAMMVMMICCSIISQTSNSSYSDSRWATWKQKRKNCRHIRVYVINAWLQVKKDQPFCHSPPSNITTIHWSYNWCHWLAHARKSWGGIEGYFSFLNWN